MRAMQLEEMAALAEGRLARPQDGPIQVAGVSTDTRTIKPGDVYVAIIGEKMDGHRFIAQAFQKGAVACMVDEKHLATLSDGLPFLVVDDTTKAYQRLGHNYLKSLKTQIIGITGSNGKTTTKDIISSLLKVRYETVKTVGNLNNHLGVPMTLLTFNPSTEIGVVEMGLGDHFNDLSLLSHIAPPHIAILTNVGDVDLETMGSRENTARAKLKILDTMTEDDIFIYNYDDEVVRGEVAKLDIRPRVITIGQDPAADHQLQLVHSDSVSTRFRLDGQDWSVNLMGQFQMYNAGIGILVGKLYGLTDEEIRQGLTVEERTAMRTELLHAHGFDILMDAYKSNPQSLREALQTMSFLTGYRKKIAILGYMLGLGDQGPALHREMGREIDPEVFDQVIFYGSSASHGDYAGLAREMMLGAMENFPANRLFFYTSKPDLIDKAKDLIEPNSLVLVKGSRDLRMEELVESLQEVTTVPISPPSDFAL